MSSLFGIVDLHNIISMRSTDRSLYRAEIEKELAQVGSVRHLESPFQISGSVGEYDWSVRLRIDQHSENEQYLVDRVVVHGKTRPNFPERSPGFLRTYGAPERVSASPQKVSYLVNDREQLVDPFNRPTLEVTDSGAVFEARRGLALSYPTGVAELVEGVLLVVSPQSQSSKRIAIDTGDRRRAEDKLSAAKRN